MHQKHDQLQNKDDKKIWKGFAPRNSFNALFYTFLGWLFYSQNSLAL